MKFLQETRTFSALSIALLTLVLIVSFLFLLQRDEERGRLTLSALLERHQALKARLGDDGALATLPLATLPLGTGDPVFLGAALIDLDGNGLFHPAGAERFWRALEAMPDGPAPFRMRPVRGGDLYFLPLSSMRRDRHFVTFFDGGRWRAEDLKLRTLSALVLLTALFMPALTWLFLKRAGRLYDAVLAEARRSPVAGGALEEPEAVVEALRRTNEELDRLLRRAHHRAGELEVLAGTLSRNIASGLMVLGPDDGIVECNRQGLEILERSGPAADPAELLAAWPLLLKNLEEALKGRGTHSRLEVAERGKTLGLNVAPLYSEERAFLGTLVLFTDLTPWKRIEEELRVQGALASLGTFASGIAHEFRNSLAALTGYMTLLRRDPPPGKGGEYLAAMVREADHINRVVGRFLEYSRLRVLHPVPVAVGEVVAEALAGLGGQYPGVRFETAGGDASLEADPALLAQALRAVAENACQARPDGRVRISWSVEGGEAKIAIADEGPGIPPEARDRLFVPFHTTRSEGTGLGLALAHRIATLHGGTLACEPPAGPGAVFTFSLPRKASQKETVPAREGEAAM